MVNPGDVGRAVRRGGEDLYNRGRDLADRGGTFVRDTLSGSGGGDDEGNPLADINLQETLGALSTAVGKLEEQVKAMGEGLTELAKALAQMKMGVNFGLDSDSINQVISALRPQPPAPVVAEDALKSLMDAINKAEQVLNQEHFMMSAVNVNLDMNLKVGPDTAVKTTVSFQITPKPIS